MKTEIKKTLRSGEYLTITMPNGNVIEIRSDEEGKMSFIGITTDRKKADKNKSQSASVTASKRGLSSVFVHTNENEDTFKVTKKTDKMNSSFRNRSFKSSEFKVGEFGTPINIFSK